MNTQEWWAQQFEQSRSHLRAVAYRILGSASEADDAVQEAWLRLTRSDAAAIENLEAWLTTVVARLCLDALRTRASRREEALETQVSEPVQSRKAASDPEHEALLADSVSVALLVILDRLAPAERIAFVLHDMFDVPFDEIASIVGRSPEASRQLASRARRRVQGAGAHSQADLSQQREIANAFLTALRSGDVEGLLAVLDPDVVVRIDEAAARPGAAREIHGARNWAKGAIAFARLATNVEIMLVNGSVAIVTAPGGRLTRVLSFTLEGGKMVAADIVGDPARLREMDLAVLE
jgi:RNA polymerase sigma-70 factor (ECF subfamily)